MNTYIGSKGYTVLKEELTNNELIDLKKKLIAKPIVLGANGFTFPIYRESLKKIYMPRYFGEEYFGIAKTIQLLPGNDIDVPFIGSLREHQKPAVDAYLEHCYKGNHAGALLELDCAAGKTVLSLYIISKLKKKTLIIVNKEFLLNQWIERMNEFLPSARIGKIQGKIIDIEDKDIVIGMLQSLSMKNYEGTVFESFGLTIIDEVHHISSEVFSNALFKIVTTYMLGLSATMERKDGTSNVIKMFLGDVIYKGMNMEHHDVVVRAIEFKTNDEEFNEVLIDYRGNPQYSKMIVKLCDYKPRSDFIVRVVGDLIEECPKKQILILGQNRSILKYLYDALKIKNYGSIGYYLGGMKQNELDESRNKQIIVGSHNMCSEGLDIPTLSTILFVTPKTDIIQSVGRILRTKHNNPIVVDIVDKHQLFQNQWNKRRLYYKKCNYDIRMTDNKKYVNMMDMSGWKNLNKVTNDVVGKCLIKL
jgi:superfamily II DNA or RNA helicase